MKTHGNKVIFFNENTYLKMFEVGVAKDNLINVPLVASQLKINYFEDRYIKMFIPADAFNLSSVSKLIYFNDYGSKKLQDQDLLTVPIERTESCKLKKIKVKIKSFIDRNGKAIKQGKLYVVDTHYVYAFNKNSFEQTISVCDDKYLTLVILSKNLQFRILHLIIENDNVNWETDLELNEPGKVHYPIEYE